MAMVTTVTIFLNCIVVWRPNDDANDNGHREHYAETQMMLMDILYYIMLLSMAI